MSFEEFYVSIRDHNRACSTNYWVGCAVGAIGMLILFLIAGYYVS